MEKEIISNMVRVIDGQGNLYDSHFMIHTLLKMQIRKIAPAVIFIFMTMFTLKMFAFNRLDVKRELTLRFTKQNLSDLFEARDL